MKHLFNYWDKIKKEIAGKRIILFLDYDGTLVPIRGTPNKAVISESTRQLLKELSKNPECKLAVISGRPLHNIEKIIGLKGIIYSGNHGLETKGHKIKFRNIVTPKLKSIIRHIARELTKQIPAIKGAIVEDKRLTLSIHYRLVGLKDMPVLKKILFKVIRPYAERNEIKVNPGKKVYEIKPHVRWDKGKVAMRLMAKGQFAVYIGDDITDEDAFRVLKRKGLTVFVGKPRSSQANYYLKDTKEVAKFLRLVLKLKHG